mgnify:CR=1 FL=1
MPGAIFLRQPEPINQRFWSKVIKNESGCWGWSGQIQTDGYGIIGVKRRSLALRYNLYAHRLSWGIHFGSIPKGLFVCHQCDNPPCTRPDHLFLGTNADNMRDSKQKGRQKNIPGRRHIGENNGYAKLTWKAARAIRTSNESCAKLGRRFGVDKTCVSRIRRGISWREP